MGLYNLRLEATYNADRMVFKMAAFRALLRVEREARVGGRDKLAEAAGVNRTTIQNIETGPDMPGIETIAKLIEAMPGLSLSAFFLELETGGLGVKPATAQGKPLGETGTHGRSRVVDAIPTDPAADADLLARLGNALITAARYASESGQTNQPIRKIRSRKS